MSLTQRLGKIAVFGRALNRKVIMIVVTWNLLASGPGESGLGQGFERSDQQDEKTIKSILLSFLVWLNGYQKLLRKGGRR